MPSRALILLTACGAVVCLLWLREWRLQPGHALRIDMFPTSRGGAVLLTAPEGQRVLYGAGGDASILEHLGRAMPFLNRRIDVLIVTGDTASKMSAATAVLERYDVGRVIVGGADALPSGALVHPAQAERAVNGMTVVLGSRSVVLGLDRDGFPSAARVVGQRMQALLLGDLPSEDERRLLAGRDSLGADVLVYKPGRQATPALLARIGATRLLAIGSGGQLYID